MKKKILAWFVLYNVISIFIAAMSLTIESDKPTEYLALLAGAYLGVGALSVLLLFAVWSIGVLYE